MSGCSLELRHALDAVAKVDEAFEPIERGGYMAAHMSQAMQEMRSAIIALAAWAARQEME